MISLLKQRHPEFLYPISLTTRTPRPHEVDGATYHFVSEGAFEEAIEKGELLEWAVNHEREHYGMLRAPVVDALAKGQTVVREISMAGMKKLMETDIAHEIFSIFLMPPSEAVMRERILKRSPLPEEEIQRRLHSARLEIAEAPLCDLQILAEEGLQEKIYEQLESAIENAVKGL